ncbi:MAG: DUF2235 domain-containing protein [Sedimentitalea sp.]|nr:DUF2235 domain-containing protein [Sedimentitalea sp.]
MHARKIILCFDGTGNEIGDNESNILKLYKGLVQSEDQIAHYIPGVGTFDGPRLFGSRLVRKARSFAGLAFGMGLEDDVLDAYRFLCHSYQSSKAKRAAETRQRDEVKRLARQLGLKATELPGRAPQAEDDHIYIFGFSRGAYAARILAGFIHNFGLVCPDRLHMITEAFRAYRSVTDNNRSTPDDIVFKALRQFEHALDPDRRVPIRALGLFDTVASMVRFRSPLRSLLRTGSPMELGTHANVIRNGSVRIVLHALAVDERRSMFRALPWQPGDFYGNRYRQDRDRRRQYVQQRWFPGYHSDIGGSQPEAASGIGKIALLWMLDALAQSERDADREDAASRPPEPGTRRRRGGTGLALKQRYRRGFLEGENRSATTPDGQHYARPDPMATLHDSMSPFWLPLEFFPKTVMRREWRPGRPALLWWYLPRCEPRRIPEGHSIDPSVFARMRGWRFYRPVNVTPPKDLPPDQTP